MSRELPDRRGRRWATLSVITAMVLSAVAAFA
jgi:hypothetical protein